MIGRTRAIRERIGGHRARAPRGRVTRVLGRATRRCWPASASADDAATGERVLWCVAGASLGAQLAPSGRAPIGVVVGAWAALAVKASLERRAAQREIDVCTAHLPPVLERIGTVLRSGQGIDRAIALVAGNTPGALGVAMREAARSASLGGSRIEVIRRLGRAPGDAVARTVRALERSERLGVPVADAVEALAADFRARARAAAETEARTAPVRMLFPLAFCFLPAFILLTIAPIAIEALRTLGGT